MIESVIQAEEEVSGQHQNTSCSGKWAIKEKIMGN